MQRHNINSLKDLLQKFLKEEGLEEGLYQTRLYALWDEMLGISVAKNTRKKFIKGRTLFVQLDSSVIRSQLFIMRDDIVKQLNNRLGRNIIDEIVLK
jgi:predicted nucleic acid-binding Zn ribbon protein